MNNRKKKVLYITGSGRCGSTILHDILGQIDGFSGIGELRYIWEHGIINNSLCGCRVPFWDCELWQGVMCEAFGSMNHVDAQKMLRLTNGLRIYHLPLSLLSHMRKRLEFQLRWYLDNMEKLYRAIQAATSSRVIIDSSKDPQYGYVLRMIPDIELYVVHLIRDPRAVAYSWSRKKLFYPDTVKPVYMDQYSSVRSSLQWNARNIIAEKYLQQPPIRYMKLRYEDLIDKTKESVKCILNMLGETAVDTSFITQNTVNIKKINHSVFGNLIRFQTGTLGLKIDKEWETKMKRLDKIAVITMTWPLLLKYRYLI